MDKLNKMFFYLVCRQSNEIDTGAVKYQGNPCDRNTSILEISNSFIKRTGQNVLNCYLAVFVQWSNCYLDLNLFC